ncbi:hypothetical protein HanHA300_Chr09g0313061 [Helianthus annuus]|nr:hypothetical protein HanHA300_Chr09g0313061 [Helianthus annuus]KAJ0892583.1 hypothetical protein HanPSC8_Chr09g0367621 [Helianthus annuus]
MGARKDLAISYSRLTQEEVETFCMEWGIGLKFKLVAPGMDVSIDQCPAGSIALYCRHFEFSNLRHPFSLFVLNVLEYYRVSFGQIHPQGLGLGFCISRFYVERVVMTLPCYRSAVSFGWQTTVIGLHLRHRKPIFA